MENIERLLSELNDKDSSSDPGSIVENIEALVFSDVAIGEKELIINLIFKSESPPNLLQYLYSHLRTKDKTICKAKIAILKFIARYVALLGMFFEHFAVLLMTSLIDNFRKEDSGEVRAAFLLPIKNLLRFCQRFGYSETLGMQGHVPECLRVLNPEAISLVSLYQYLLDDLKFNKKTSTKTAKSDIFKILGLLCNAYPMEAPTLQQVRGIAEQCHWALQQNFGATSTKDIDMSMISGAFSCLDRLCYNFESDALPSAKERTSLFEYILKAISAVKQGDLFKYAISSKALRLIKHHTLLFRDLIGPNASQVHTLVEECYKLDKKTLAKHSEEALLAVISEISSCICIKLSGMPLGSSTSEPDLRDQQPISTARTLLDVFLSSIGRLDDTQSSPKESAYHIKALSVLAPAVAALERHSLISGISGTEKHTSVAAVLVEAVIASDQTSMTSLAEQSGDNLYKVSIPTLMKNVYVFMSVACLVDAANTSGIEAASEVTAWLLSVVQEAVILYPHLNDKQQVVVQKGLCYLLQAFIASDIRWTELMQVLMPTLIARTASRQDFAFPGSNEVFAQSEEDADNEDGVVVATSKPLYTSYQSLWCELFAPENKTMRLQFLTRQLDYEAVIGIKLHNECLKQVLIYIRSLDLQYSESETTTIGAVHECQSDEYSAPSSGDIGIVPKNPVDQDILINLASFLDLILPRYFTTSILEWLPLLIPELISLSSRYPMVSAAYRIISSSFRVLSASEYAASVRSQGFLQDTIPAEFNAYLQQLKTADDDLLSNSMQKFQKDPKLSQLLVLLSDFLEEVKQRVVLYSDELLASVLRMILSAPRILISRVEQVASVICLALDTGFEVELALHTIDKFIQRNQLHRQALQHHLPNILTLLEGYLVSDSSRGGQSQSMKFKSKLVAKLNFLSSQKGDGTDANHLVGIQRQVLRVLGRLGGAGQLMIRSPEDVVHASLAWTKKDQVLVKLPLPGVLPSLSAGSLRLTQLTASSVASDIIDVKVSLDRLLPRILEISSAQSSASDRQAKLAAVEGLHAIIILLIGSAATSPNRGRQGAKKEESELSKIYSRIFPTAIELSVDSDLVCRKLFEKLLFQIVRWFSGQKNVGEDESAALVDSLLNGLCTTQNSSIRNQCSKAVCSFFEWSIKQSSKQELESCAAPDALIDKLLVAALHPSERFRMGAVQVLNAIYIRFREETSLVHRHLLQIVYVLMKSLRMTGSSPQAVKEVQRALKTYGNIVVRSIASKGDRSKLLDVVEERNHPKCLRELVDWLWLQTVHTQKSLRSCSMQLFGLFCPLLNDISPSTGLSTNTKESNAIYVDSFFTQRVNSSVGSFVFRNQNDENENYVDLVDGIDDLGSIEIASSACLASPRMLCIMSRIWLEKLWAALDFYCWSVRKNILPQTIIFENSNEGSKVDSEPISSKRRRVAGAMSAELKPFESAELLIKCRTFVHETMELIRRESVSAETINDLIAGIPEIDSLESQELRAEILYALVSLINISIDNCRSEATRGDCGKAWLKSIIWTSEFVDLICLVCLNPLRGKCLHQPSLSLFPKYSSCALLREHIPCAVHKLLRNSEFLDPDLRLIGQLRSEVYGLCSYISSQPCLDSETICAFANASNLITSLSLEPSRYSLEMELPRIRQTQFDLFLKACESIGVVSDPIVADINCRIVSMALASGMPVTSIAGNLEMQPELYSNSKCVLHVILNPLRGPSIVEKFESEIVSCLLGHNGSMFHETATALLGKYQYLLLAENQALVLRIIERLLSKCLLRFCELVDQQLASIDDVVGVLLAFTSVDLRIFPVAILFQLLDVDSSIPHSQHLRKSIVLRDYVTNHCASLLQSPTACTNDLVNSLQMLPYIFAGVVANCPRPINAGYIDDESSKSKILMALEELVANKFPLSSADVSISTEKGKEFVILLNAYMDSFANCGAPFMLSPLLPILREGSAHKYYKLISSYFSRLVGNIDRTTVVGADLAVNGSGLDTCLAITQICRVCIAHIVDEGQTMEVKRILMDLLCLPILRLCNSSTLESIVAKAGSSIMSSQHQAVNVMKALTEKLQVDISAVSFDSEATNALLFVQSSAYAIIEIVFDRCTLTALKGRVTSAFTGLETNTGKELTQAICRLAHKLVRSELPVTAHPQIRFRLYSSAFSCLTVIVAKTQTDEKFFNSFIFEAKPETGMWAHVIDTTIRYRLENRKFESKYVGGETATIASATTIVNGTTYRLGGKKSSGYSQLLKGSILSSSSISQLNSQITSQTHVSTTQVLAGFRIGQVEDWSEMDSEVTKPYTDTSIAASGLDNEIQSIVGLDDQIIVFEMNDLNQQNIMVPIVRAVQRMHALFSEQWELLAASGSLPKWLNICKDLVTDGINESSTAIPDSSLDLKRNIRLFVLRLLLNQPVACIVAPFISNLLPSILSCCLHDLCSEDSTCYNYFLRDVVFTFCDSWSEAIFEPSVYVSVGRFLTRLFGITYNENVSLARENMTSVTTLVNLWVQRSRQSGTYYGQSLMDVVEVKSVLPLLRTEMAPTGGAHGKALGRGFEGVKRRLHGLEQLSLLLRSGLSILKLRGPGTDGRAVLTCLVDCIGYPRKEVMEEASHAAGLLLNSLHSTGNSIDSPITYHSFVEDLSNALLSKLCSNKGWDAVATCLKGICTAEPSFLSRDLFIKIQSWFKKMSPRAKYEYLTALVHTSCSYAEDIMSHMLPHLTLLLADISIVSFGKGRNITRLPMIQINTLKLLKLHWRHLKLADLLGIIFSEAFSLTLNPATSLEVRTQAYDLLIDISSYHETLQLTPTNRNVTWATQVTVSEINVADAHKHLSLLLLRGLNDPDDDGIDVDEAQEGGQFSNLSSGAVISQFTQLTSPPLSPVRSSENSTSMPTTIFVIRRKIFDFFNGVYGLSLNIVDRLNSLMTALFDPQCADDWLHYTAFLLLAVPGNTRQFRTLLFESNLSNSSTFAPLNIKAVLATSLSSNRDSDSSNGSSSNSTNQVFTPLFSLDRKVNSQLLSATQQSQLFGTQSVDGSRLVIGQLRATQELNWTQTQSSANAVSNTSRNIGAKSKLKFTGGEMRLLSTQSVMNYFPGGGELRSQGFHTFDPSTGSTPSLASQHQNPQCSGFGFPRSVVFTQQRVPPRFKSSLSGGSATFNYYQFNNKAVAEMRKPKKMVIYRSYRDGELPDIRISLADVLCPIQVLCSRDPIIAAHIVSVLIETSLSTNEVINSASISLNTLLDAIQQMMSTISNAGVFNNHLVSVLLNMCLWLTRVTVATDLDAFRIQPKIVGELALKSFNLHAGVALLEEQLLVSSGSIGRKIIANSSRSSTSRDVTNYSDARSVEFERELWHQLGRLYNALGEKDIFLGLTSKISARAETRAALDAEFTGDFSTAVKIYTDLSKKYSKRIKESEHLDSQERDDWSVLVTGDETAQAESAEVDLWDDRTLECLRQLCDWNGLEQAIEKLVPATSGEAITMNPKEGEISLSFIGENCDLRERYLSLYLGSMININDEIHNKKLYQFLDYALQATKGSLSEQSTLRSWLEIRHSAELAALFSRRREWGRVRAYTQMSYSKFLVEWSGLHPCATLARRNLLRNLQYIVEVEDVADTRVNSKSIGGVGGGSYLSVSDGVVSTGTVKKNLLYKWCASDPDNSDPVWIWDRIVNHRYCLIDSELFPGEETSPISRLALVHLADFHRSAALAAIGQGNLNAGKTHLEKSSRMKRQAFGRVDTLTMPDILAVCNYNKRSIARKIDLRNSSVADISEMYKKNLKLLEGKLNQLSMAGSECMEEAVAVQLLFSEWQRNFGLYISNPSDSIHATDGFGTSLADAVAVNSKSRELMLQALIGYQRASVKSDSLVASATSFSVRSDVFGSFAKHCDFMLAISEAMTDINQTEQTSTVMKRSRDGETKINSSVGEQMILDNSLSIADTITMAELTISAFMRGLQYGNLNCRSKLLRMLKIVGKFSGVQFAALRPSELAKIPPWMLINYAPQLMGCLDLPEGPVAAALLELVAKHYPSALHYPYKITAEFLGIQGRQLTTNLKLILKNSSVDAFVESLFGLTHPEHRWRDGLKSLAILMNAQAKSSSLSQSVKADIQRAISESYNALKSSTLSFSWRFVGSRIGRYNLKWAKQVLKIADGCVGPNGEKLLNAVGRSAFELLDQKTRDLCQISNHTGGVVPLSEFSEWLSDFDSSAHRIEVPGQYFHELNGPPMVSAHEFILGVDSALLVMSSIRKPKRIKFLTSSGREAAFLVKGGEDLRNDERIEKLFLLMNSVVSAAADVSTSRTISRNADDRHSLGLCVKTYAVIPMNSRVGMLEWVNNTIPLKAIISSEMARDPQFLAKNPRAAGMVTKGKIDIEISDTNAYIARSKWVTLNSNSDYHNMYKAKDKTSIEKLNSTIVADLPDHFIRKYLLSLSTGPESFLTLRAQFAKTLAVSSVFGYVLGIGDRHLDNLMIDKSTGSVLQIDFGICFGMGASVLPVPELIPFRLTPQLRGALRPLDGSGLLRQYMIYCMRCLRADEGLESISNVLDAYLNDPLVEWMQNPRMSREETIELNQSENSGQLWEPRRRISNAMRKLRGAHPVAILLEDLSMNPTVKKEGSFDALGAIVWDSASSFPRKQVETKSQSDLVGSEIEASGSKLKRTRTVLGSSREDSESLPDMNASTAPESALSMDRTDSGSANGSSLTILAGMLDPRAGGSRILKVLTSQPALEVGDQVEVLMRMASDPQVTLRQYVGLAAWL